jgi:hypothetical protein
MDSGYAIHPNVVGAEDLALLDQLEGLEPLRTKAGARHLMSIPAVRRVAEDERLLDVARRHIGPSAVPFRVTLFDKSPRTNWLIVWHQDTALPLVDRRDADGWGPWSVKASVQYAHAPATALERVIALRLSVDDSGPDNGPLRVLPGTHRRGVLTDEEVASLTAEIPPVDCCVRAGGVVVMRPMIIHSSSKATSERPRRVLHIEYTESLDIAPGMRLAVV